MEEQKLNTIHWFIQQIKTAPNAHLWLAFSGSIITGIPIEPAEYYQTIFGNPNLPATSEIGELLALKDVKVKHGINHNIFNVALVDLNLVVAWGAYDPNTSYSIP